MIQRKNKYVVYDDKGYVVIMSRMKDICRSHAYLTKEILPNGIRKKDNKTIKNKGNSKGLPQNA
jgi:hypothetical protein